MARTFSRLSTVRRSRAKRPALDEKPSARPTGRTEAPGAAARLPPAGPRPRCCSVGDGTTSSRTTRRCDLATQRRHGPRRRRAPARRSGEIVTTRRRHRLLRLSSSGTGGRCTVIRNADRDDNLQTRTGARPGRRCWGARPSRAARAPVLHGGVHGHARGRDARHEPHRRAVPGGDERHQHARRPRGASRPSIDVQRQVVERPCLARLPLQLGEQARRPATTWPTVKPHRFSRAGATRHGLCGRRARRPPPTRPSPPRRLRRRSAPLRAPSRSACRSRRAPSHRVEPLVLELVHAVRRSTASSRGPIQRCSSSRSATVMPFGRVWVTRKMSSSSKKWPSAQLRGPGDRAALGASTPPAPSPTSVPTYERRRSRPRSRGRSRS